MKGWYYTVMDVKSQGLQSVGLGGFVHVALQFKDLWLLAIAAGS